MSQYSGFIVADPAGGTVEETDIEVLGTKANAISLQFIRNDFGLKTWGHYKLHSPRPLADEEWSPAGFDYRVYVVRGRARLIVLAPRKTISEYVWTRIFQRQISRIFRRVNLLVPAMVEYCAAQDSEFLITSLFGDCSGSNTLLKRVSLYGDEVTKSSVFEQHHDEFNFYRAGLGRRLFDGMPRLASNEEGEIAQLGSMGTVSMELSNSKDAGELISLINFVMAHRWVEDWVPE